MKAMHQQPSLINYQGTNSAHKTALNYRQPIQFKGTVDSVSFSGKQKSEIKTHLEGILQVYYDEQVSEENKKLVSEALQEFEDSKYYQNNKRKLSNLENLLKNDRLIVGQYPNGSIVVAIGNLNGDKLTISVDYTVGTSKRSIKSGIKSIYGQVFDSQFSPYKLKN